jgi:hypothetical protein
VPAATTAVAPAGRLAAPFCPRPGSGGDASAWCNGMDRLAAQLRKFGQGNFGGPGPLTYPA